MQGNGITFDEYCEGIGVELRPWQRKAAGSFLSVACAQCEARTGKTFLAQLLERFLDRHGNMMVVPEEAPFDPEAVDFKLSGGGPGDSLRGWTRLVSHEPYIRFHIDCKNYITGGWEIRRYIGDGDDPDDTFGETSYRGAIFSHRFGCELLRSMGYPEGLLVQP